MDWKVFATVFGAVFIAEMADKTQLVTMLFAADKAVSKLTVLSAAILALALTSVIGVAAGTLLSHLINPRWMSMLAGVAFVLIGVITFYHGWQNNP